jgi:hypothetical protein
MMLAANNPTTGDSAVMSFGPKEMSFFTAGGGGVESSKTFGLPMSPDDLRSNYTSLTIQTSPEDAQKVIEYIRQLSTSTTPYAAFASSYTQNCSTVCREALKIIGALQNNNNAFSPTGVWQNAYRSQIKGPCGAGGGLYNPKSGKDYGRSRYGGMSAFQFYGSLFDQDNSSVTVTVTNKLPNGQKDQFSF